jgi:hypothetical protein
MISTVTVAPALTDVRTIVGKVRAGIQCRKAAAAGGIRIAELQFIRSRVPADRFAGSSFQSEWIATDFVVSRLYPTRLEEFTATVGRHLADLQNGNAYLFDQIPPSFFGAGD